MNREGTSGTRLLKYSSQKTRPPHRQQFIYINNQRQSYENTLINNGNDVCTFVEEESDEDDDPLEDPLALPNRETTADCKLNYEDDDDQDDEEDEDREDYSTVIPSQTKRKRSQNAVETQMEVPQNEKGEDGASPPKRKRKVEDDPDFEPIHLDKRFHKLNRILEAAGLEEFDTKRLSQERQRKYAVRKLRELTQTCIKILDSYCIEVDPSSLYEESKKAKKTEASFQSVMKMVKAKYDSSDYCGKVQALTIVPENWTTEETIAFFSTDTSIVPSSQVNKALKLRKAAGPLAVVGKRKGRGLTAETTQCVMDFYRRECYSRLIPGKKNTVLVMENGAKVRKQKRILQFTMKEIHKTYVEVHGDKNPVQFSTFARLRPRELVLAKRY